MKKIISSILAVAVFIASLTIIPFTSTNVTAAETNGEYEIKYDASDRVIVSLGDSYSSGEGLDDYYDSKLPLEDKIKSQDWLSHRSPNSWSGQLVLKDSNGNPIIMNEHRDNNWFFTAMSGAVAKNIAEPTKKDYLKIQLSGGENTTSTKEINRDELKIEMGTTPIDRQIDIFKHFDSRKADYVTMTMGGNDVQFVPIVESTALNCKFLEFATSKVDVERCIKLSEKINDSNLKDIILPATGVVGNLVIKHGPSVLSMSNLKSYLEYIENSIMPDTIDRLEENYKLIAKKAGSQAHIIIAGYPKIISESNNNPIWTAEEASLINEKISFFNKMIADKIKYLSDNGMNISFVSVEEEFADHGAYSTEGEYISGIDIAGQQEISDIFPVGGCSFHPNADGVEAYRKCVQDEIDKIETKKTRIWGKVTDKNNNPISGVKVTLWNSDKIKTSDKNGDYSFEVDYEEGRHYQLSFEKSGYETLVVAEEKGGNRITINAKLEKKPVDIVVSGTVKDTNNNLINDVKVTLTDSENNTYGSKFTENGKYSFEITSENGRRYTVKFEKLGYETMSVTETDGGTDITINAKLEKEETTYTAVDLIDKSIPEIIELMGDEFEVSSSSQREINFSNNDVFPGMTFWIDSNDYSNKSIEIKNNDIYVDGQSVKTDLKSGKYKLSDIGVRSEGKINSDLNAGMTYNEIADIIGDFSVEASRPPHVGGALPALGVSLKYLYKTDGKVIEFHFSYNDIVKNPNDENGQKVFTANEVRNVDPKLTGVFVYKDSTDWKTLYKSQLNNLKISDYAFELYDVDQDGIPELFVSKGSFYASGLNIYTVTDNQMNDIFIGSAYGIIAANSKKHYIAIDNMHNGYYSLIVYKKSGGQFVKIIDASSNYGAVMSNSPELYYKINDETVSKDKYTEITQEYQNLSWDKVGRKYEITESNINSVIDNWVS